MPEMIITRGVPASGKSTFARNWVAEMPDERVEINRDNIRLALGFPLLGTHEQENMVTMVQDKMMAMAFKSGTNIIISNTNLRARFVKDLIRMGMAHDYTVEVMDFDVPLDELLRRDAARDKSVGSEVIETLHQRFNTRSSVASLFKGATEPRADVFSPLTQDVTLPRAVVFDMDGTLANLGGRNPYDYSTVLNDGLNENIAELARGYAARGMEVIVFSGREDCSYNDTLEWLNKHDIPVSNLYMRRTGDKRKDSVIKRELIEAHLVDKFFVESWIDDRKQVVDMVRATYGHQNPTICLQVDYGDF